MTKLFLSDASPFNDHLHHQLRQQKYFWWIFHFSKERISWASPVSHIDTKPQKKQKPHHEIWIVWSKTLKLESVIINDTLIYHIYRNRTPTWPHTRFSWQYLCYSMCTFLCALGTKWGFVLERENNLHVSCAIYFGNRWWIWWRQRIKAEKEQFMKAATESSIFILVLVPPYPTDT